ncbi:hypothetical protein C2845_PM02G17820 [Panicum miliaceum]|uniref:DUF659 domain-containing protein n=1 Tax=Panicum miliaceum TaxID=4540 RepID=A0A3L6SE81_PANMI|nr:hypothetical protein C2845_PM02G17820 [Panicum miliaceum]
MGDDDHDIYGNTSQDNDLKSKNQDSAGQTDMLSVPTKEQAMKKGENIQAIHTAEQMEKKRRATECLAAWFNEAGIPFNTACLGSFDLMLEAIAQCGLGLHGPSLHELDGLLLNQQVLAINRSIEALKKSWALEECSILVDLNMGYDGRRLLNLAVHCSQGVSFLRSIELPSGKYDEAFTCQLVDSCIEEVGEKNVVQIITNTNSEMVVAKRPNLFWTHCAVSCIGMMLEDIGHIPLIKRTIAKASFGPVVGILRRMANGRSYMGFIYGELENAKREIAFRFENKEEHYLPIWSHIDFRINYYLKKPLHLLGYYLNPLFYYRNINEIEKTEIFRDAFVECTHRMYQDQSMQEKIVNQLMLYRTASESFCAAHAIHAQMTIEPVIWWESHGAAAKELSTMALRILRLTCGSVAYEPSWIAKIHREKPPWVQHKKFKDSMFVTVNKRIQGKAQM